MTTPITFLDRVAERVSSAVEKQLRKWARRFFEGRITVLHVQRVFDAHEVMTMSADTLRHIREATERDMVRRIADLLQDKGLITFEESYVDYGSASRQIRAILHVI